MTDVIVTDFGLVKMTKSAKYLDGIYPNWRELISKKPRSKIGKYALSELRKIEASAIVVAKTEFMSGGELKEI